MSSPTGLSSTLCLRYGRGTSAACGDRASRQRLLTDTLAPFTGAICKGRSTSSPAIPGHLLGGQESALDRDRGTPRDATPPTPPGIRVPYHGGSTELCLGGRIEFGEDRATRNRRCVGLVGPPGVRTCATARLVNPLRPPPGT